MIYFLDASVLVKRYVPEAGSDRVLALMRRTKNIALARITFAESCSALTRAWRDKRLDDAELQRGLEQLAEDFSAVQVVELRHVVIESTRDLLLRWPLRAYDAVQLSCARRLKQNGASVDFWCADLALAEAARGEGLRSTIIS